MESADKGTNSNSEIRGSDRIDTRTPLPFSPLRSPSLSFLSFPRIVSPSSFVTVFSAQQFAHQSNYLARNNRKVYVTHGYDGNSFTGYFFFFFNFFSFSRAFFLSRYSFARPVGCKTRFLIVWWKSVGGTGFTTVKICERYVILFFFN